MADAGAEVTVLQAGSELGEIGAGIDAGAHAALAVEKELRGRETVAQKGWRTDIRKETYDSVVGWFAEDRAEAKL